MKLEYQNFVINDLKLSFLSFIHPYNGIIWITADHFASSLGYIDTKSAIANITAYKMSWAEIVADIDEPIAVPPNWQDDCVLINKFGMQSLILNTDLVDRHEINTWMLRTMIISLLKPEKNLPDIHTNCRAQHWALQATFHEEYLKLANKLLLVESKSREECLRYENEGMRLQHENMKLQNTILKLMLFTKDIVVQTNLGLHNYDIDALFAPYNSATVNKLHEFLTS